MGSILHFRTLRQVVFVPAGPDFALEHEIKNVVTVVAKTVHYWTEHRTAQER